MKIEKSQLKVLLLTNFMAIVFATSCSMESENYYFIWINNAAGLNPGSIVTSKGMEIGVIKNMNLESNGKILVTLAVNKGVRIPTQSRFVLKTTDMTGNKEIDIENVAGSTFYKNGDTIVNGLIERTLNINMKGVKEVVDSVLKKKLISIDSVKR